MFEKTRSNLKDRLVDLLDRYDAIAKRARKRNEWAQLAVRMGVGGKESAAIAHEIATKSEKQAALCGDSISHLLVDRALPIMFSGAVSRAERFATQCEAILGQMDLEESVGRAAAQARFGGSPSSQEHTDRQKFFELASLADQLAEADAAQSLKLKMEQHDSRSDSDAENP